ncbi:MAG: recombinase family protein [Armatimonadota bacterium]|nr:recombinase family protein [Armatimonadota bacterium]
MTAHNKFVIGVYARVSDPRQIEEGHSIETQLSRAREYADAAFGEGEYELREYVEPGITGDNRPRQMLRDGPRSYGVREALTDLLEDADNHELDFVLFFEVSRGARNEHVHYFVHEWLDERDIGFRFLNVDVDPTTDEGMLVTGMLQIAAAYQRRQHIWRVKQGWADRTAAGYPPGGPARYGFDRQDPEDVPAGGRRGYTRNEEQWRWVRWMFERYQSGWTTTRIADELCRLGVPRSQGGTNWDSSAVRKILLHPAYAGLRPKQDGEMIRAQWYEDRMWDPEDRELILKRLKRNRRLGATTINRADYPLNGILTCSHCGNRLYAALTPGGRRQYICRGDHEDCPGLQKVAEPVEEAVLRTVRELAASDRVQELALDEVQSVLEVEADRFGEQAASLQEKLKRVQSRVDGLTDLRLDGDLSSEEYREQKGRLTTERDTLEEQIAAVQAQIEDQSVRKAELSAIQEVLQDFDAIWDALDPQERREALFTVIESAEMRRVGGDDLELRLKVHFLPERVLPLPNYNKRSGEDGASALTPRELAYLKHRRDGRSDRAIAETFDVEEQTVRGLRRHIAKRLSVETIEEAVELASDRIDAEMHALPMEGRVRKRGDGRPKFGWTAKRKAILAGLAEGLPRQEIARRMGITKKTLDNRIGRMKQQAAVNSDEELVTWAIENEVIAP